MTRILLQLANRAKIRPLGIAMPGTGLGKRVRKIVDDAPIARVSFARAACAVVSCTIVCAALLAVTLARAQSSGGQDWEEAAGGKMVFDVASVKRDTSGQFMPPNFPLDAGDSYHPTGGLLSADLRISSYIGFAYKLTGGQQQLLGSELPQWANSDRFDIQARAADGTNPTKDQMRLMMQSLLAARLKLAVHMETRQMPVYVLVLAKDGKIGPQLKQYAADHKCGDSSAGAPDRMTTDGFPNVCGLVGITLPSQTGPRKVGARNVTMQQFVDGLPGLVGLDLGRPVLDRTGLSGKFDITMQWVPETSTDAVGTPDTSGPALEALREQLGLKLEATTSSVNMLVVDHIEEPTPN